MANNVTRASVNENGESPYAVTIEVSGHTISVDEPASAGGAGIGPAPYDFLTAALGACTSMTVRMYAEQQNWPLEEVEVVVEFRKERPEGQKHPVDIFEKRVILHGSALTDEQRRKLIEIAAKCPIQRTLENPLQIKTFE